MPRAATAAARAKLRALASTYDPESSDSDKSAKSEYAGSGSAPSAPSSVVSDDGSSSDFDPPTEDEKPARTPKRAPRGRGTPRAAAKPRVSEGTLGGKNSLGLSAAELRILNSAGGSVTRPPARGGGGTGRVGVFPSGGPTPFITTLKWEGSDVPPPASGSGSGWWSGAGKAKAKEEAMDVDAEEEDVNGEKAAASVGWRDPRLAHVAVEPAPTREARRERYRDLARRVGVLSPPENWEGEGWVPEMYGDSYVNGTGKGKEKEVQNGEGTVNGAEEAGEGESKDDSLPEGWRWRTDIRLDVPVPRQEDISEEEGRKHVPGTHVRVQYGVDAEGEHIPLLACKKFAASSGASAGAMFNVGAPVWGLDWCPGSQHVAVSTCASDPVMGSRTSTPGSIQIWSTDGECQVVLCLDSEVCALKWMPVGVSDPDTLGVLAAVQLDGAVCVYAVPRPASERRYVRAQAMLRIEVEDATAMCLDWLSGQRLAVGFSNGHIGTWSILTALEAKDLAPLPDTYTPVALAAISSLHVGRVPPVDSEGEPAYDADPYLVVFSSYDGSTGLLDLRDPAGTITFCRSRIPCASVSFSPQNAAPLYIDSDYMVVMAQLRNASNPGTFILAPNRGPVLGLACSDYHPMVAAAAADGGLTISSAATGFFRRKGVGLFYVRLYEVDYDERLREGRAEPTSAGAGADTAGDSGDAGDNGNAGGTGSNTDAAAASGSSDRWLPGTLRIIDAYQPEHSTIEATNKRKEENRDDTAVKTAAWDREVGLHRAVWQNVNGIRNAGWLASGGYAGIVRVEEVRGTELWRHERDASARA